jgi:hypothetical protein
MFLKEHIQNLKKQWYVSLEIIFWESLKTPQKKLNFKLLTIKHFRSNP